MSEEQPVTTKKPHPLPGLCWVWAVGCICLTALGGLVVATYLYRHETARSGAKVPAPDDPLWQRVLALGSVEILTGLAYGWLWYRFAILRLLNRKTWNVGTGLILAGAALLYFTGWQWPALVFLLVLAIWGQGFTRQHFDKL